MAIINGTAGNDGFGTLNGTGDDDTINGLAGDDVLYGIGGKDILNGGDGNDTFFYQFGGEISDGLNNYDVISGGIGYDQITTLDSIDLRLATITSIERIQFIDTLAGDFRFLNISASQIGTTFTSVLNLYGDTDADVLQIDMSTSTTLNLSTLTFSNWVGGATVFDGDRVQVNGDADAEVIVGSVVNDYIEGAGGNDTLYGLGGIDFLTGGDDNDTLYGGAGADSLSGGDGTDYARYDEGNYGNLTIRLDAPNLNTGVAAGDTFTGIEGLVGGGGNDTIVGNGLTNLLFGGGGNDLIYGQGGNDYLNGGAGTNQLYGGAGADAHVGGTGIDYARYDDANWGNLVVSLIAGLATNTGAAAGDTYTGIEGVVGGLGSDLILGNTVNNYIFGGNGADYINGLTGNDYLSGGASADRFVFSTAVNAATNVDRIIDFATGIDDFNLAQVIFTSIGATLDATELRLGTVAADANDYLIYNSANGQLFYDANGSGAGGQTLFATLNAGTALGIGDFVMV
ncbi:MAG: calcium-binding protein [Rhizobiaceae bacterium]